MKEEQIKKNDHILTSEIEQDIEDIQEEIDQFEEELEVLIKDRKKNRLDIYMREGRIAKRKDFISKLQSILDYRRMHKY